MSKFIGQKCTGCNTTITEQNDAYFLAELIGYDTLNLIEKYQKPLCTECKKEMLFANILSVV